VNGARVFSKIDLRKAFHQLLLDEASRNLTTITTHVGLFRYTRLHMGISCASEIFTETIRVLLERCPGQINMTDDILVYGKDQEEHQQNLMAVSQSVLEDSGLTVNADKCEFYKSEIRFFGIKISADGIAPTTDRCQALHDA
jgi:hypothetical protein